MHGANQISLYAILRKISIIIGKKPEGCSMFCVKRLCCFAGKYVRLKPDLKYLAERMR